MSAMPEDPNMKVSVFLLTNLYTGSGLQLSVTFLISNTMEPYLMDTPQQWTPMI